MGCQALDDAFGLRSPSVDDGAKNFLAPSSCISDLKTNWPRQNGLSLSSRSGSGHLHHVGQHSPSMLSVKLEKFAA
jgi:hypothetical protein